MTANKPALRRARDEVLSLNVLAGKASDNSEQFSQFGVLMRHFLDRFFGSEFASVDGDAKTRLVLKSGVKFTGFARIGLKNGRLRLGFMQQSIKLHGASFSPPAVLTCELDPEFSRLS